MNTLVEIESAVAQLPTPQQEALHDFLSERLGRRPFPKPARTPVAHSVLDIAPASLGEVVRPLSPDDDLLGEMLETRA